MAVDDEFDYESALLACAAGDRQALQALYRREAARLLGVAFRIVRDRQRAEDVVHDSFVQVWTHAGTFDPALGSGRGWLYSIARHRALNLVRRDLRTVSVDEERLEALEAEGRVDLAAEPAEAFALGSALGRLEECLARLDAAKRNSILYAYVEGCSHSEIAARLGSPLGSVKAWIRRGMAALRECLA